MAHLLCLLMLWKLNAAEVRPLHEAIAGRATGMLHFEGEDDTFRESVLYWDGESNRISIANMPTIVLPADKVSTSVRRYGKGDWDVVFYAWSNSNVGWSVDIMIHGDEILRQEHAANKLPKEILLPRARIKLAKAMFFKVADGHFFADDQDKSTIPLTIKDIASNDGQLVTFADGQRRCAEDLVTALRIRTRE